jgi:Trk K+ transport system NAD-binding subunit/Kef-type K+ transport system membrane component KefB
MLELFTKYQEVFTLPIGFIIVAISANQLARLFQQIHLPLITGLIVMGILTGPYLLNLIPISAPFHLKYINDISLGFIAFAAGAELYLKELKKQINSIKWNSFGQLFITFIIGVGALWLAADYIPFLANKETKVVLAISSLMATIFIASSPASAIAIINELRSKGPFTQTVMGVTVVKDFLVVILFSICISLTQSVLKESSFDFIQIIIVLAEFLISFLLGIFVVGYALKTALSLSIHKRTKSFLILLIGYSAYWTSDWLAVFSLEKWGHALFLEPLLICILASFYVTNFSKFRAEFLNQIRSLELYIFVAFFTLTGASLNISVFVEVLSVALLLFSLRLIALIFGSVGGGLIAGDPIKHISIGWMSYITQAGVTLGLATVVSNQFPEWGPIFSTAVLALILINQFVGPPLFKWAIYQVNEARTRGHQNNEITKEVLIFGFEPQSVSLAQQLMKKNYRVQLATLKDKDSFDDPTDISILYLKSLDKDALAEIDFSNIEIVVTLLSDDANLLICEYAYHEFGTRELVVRLNHRYNSKNFLDLEAKVIDPSTAMVSLLDHFVRSPQATSLLLGMDQNQDTRDIEILNPNLHGIHLRDLRLPSDVIILSVIRGGQTIISHGYTRLRIHDTVTVVGLNQSLDDLEFKFIK